MILRHHRNHPFSWLFDVVETVPLEPSVTQSRVVLQENHIHEAIDIHKNCQDHLVASAGPIHRHSPLLWNFPAYSSISKQNEMKMNAEIPPRLSCPTRGGSVYPAIHHIYQVIHIHQINHIHQIIHLYCSLAKSTMFSSSWPSYLILILVS